ncbi:dihydrolipoyl dehydrogenase family protein [Desulfogranum mediterraneum]|uniref:dihydrolipoyl dehydrogenase family protein n=1 Tax=Desulfogranum mediterraneum TaxID=160661 RepID=UPI00041226D0|nr:FAD-dependent oxidoreductase [Desulfogranum mediterraneum]
MSTFDYDIGIIGGGAAGLTITAGAAQLGARTLLIEKEPLLGGDCLHYGCVPSKTLIKSAHVYHQIKEAERYGLPTAAIGPVNFRSIAARIQEVISTIQVHDSVERFCRLGAQVGFGQAEFVDEHTVLLDGSRRSAKYWVIATGSEPAPPRVKCLTEIEMITNRDIFSLDELPGSMIVLGAGPIAMEMAQAFNRLGTQVSVIQRSAQILSKEDRDMADTVMAAMEEEGVRFFLGATVLAASQKGGRRRIEFSTGDGSRHQLEADQVLLAQGRTPNTRDLGLERIELAHDLRGVTVDRRLRTSHRHIFAAGDITGSYQFTHAAGYEGGIVVSNAIFRLPRKTNYTWLPWCTYTDPELASVGLNERRARALGIDYTVWSEEFAANDRALAEGATRGKLKLLLDEREKPIGVQIAGPRAGDLLGEWIAILGGGVKLSTLAGTVHPYPTLGEINKRVAGSYLSPKIFSSRVKKGLKLFFQLKGPVEDPCSRLSP